MDLSNIFVTPHALKRFMERWPDFSIPKNWEKALRKALSEVEEIKKTPQAAVIAPSLRNSVVLRGMK